MMKNIVFCILITIFISAVFIDARRRRIVRRFRWVSRTVCTPHCSTVRSCTRGGQCTRWGTRSFRTCAQHATVKHCSHYVPMSEEICLSHNKHCLHWNTMSQRSCARYATSRVPTMALVDGPCVKFAKRCAHYRTEPVTRCAKWGNRCAAVTGESYRQCAQWNAAREERKCAKWKTVTDSICTEQQNKCAQFRNVTRTWCAKHSEQCAQWAHHEKFVTKPVCKAKTSVCLRHKSYKYVRCLKFSMKCGRFDYKSKKVCALAKRKCVGWRHYKHRVCVKGVRKCTKWFKQRLGDKCVQWKYHNKSTKKCAAYGKKWIKGVKKCLKWSLPSCHKWSTIRVFRRGKLISTKRRCAIKTKIRASRKTIRGKRSCTKIRKCGHVGKKRCRSIRVCVGRSRRSKTCRIYQSKRHGIVKRCGRTVFGCQVRASNKSTGALHVCCKRKLKHVPSKRRCLKYSTKKGYFKRYCKKHTTVVTRRRFCSKRVGRFRRVCVSWKGKCVKYALRTRKICNKVAPKCVSYKTLKTRYCAAFKRDKCAKSKTYTGKKCVRWGSKCTAFALNKVVVGHFKTCLRSSKVCSKIGSHTFALCTRYNKVCSKTTTNQRQVCVRYEKRTIPRTCARYNTLIRTKCARYEKYCKRSKTSYKRSCTRHARYCTSYLKVYKPVSWKIHHYCASWTVKQVPTTCLRYGHSCTRRIHRITGRRCASWRSQTICARQAIHNQSFCAQHAPPRCWDNRTCTRSCRSIQVQVRSDIHMQQVDGTWIDFNYAGVFDYFGHGPCDAQIRLERLKYGSISTGVAIKCNANVFRATSQGVFVNDKLVTTDGVAFGTNGKVTKLPGKAEQYRFESGFGLNVRVDLETKFNLVSIVFHELKAGTEFKDTGLLVRGAEKFAKDYVVPEKESLFKRYVEFEKIPDRVDVSVQERKDAQARCAKVLKRGTKAFTQCVYDLLATGLNLAVAYANEKAMINK